LKRFKSLRPCRCGVELELQLVNTHDYDLAPYAHDMLRLMARRKLPGSVVPEMTSSMIEISTRRLPVACPGPRPTGANS